MTWKKLLEPDGTYAVDEGERYLFAIATHRVNSYDSGWFYFVDALVWDAETPPQWSTDEHGYSGCEDEMWFMPLPEPPEADQPAATETVPTPGGTKASSALMTACSEKAAAWVREQGK